ncbi:hypothetical protein EZV62_027860 [Acer yangbiense]|uniref:PGG domain-containing protein n=1 Tax=Acer yangbiense TaxID=1000413 RepID=A0A5C7GPS4_9ROSI|nr:hypothetical protein EZV62_027860 [Acer yangbiense]
MVKLLLAKEEIQKSKHDQQGRTPLHFAARFRYIKILKNLLITDKSAAYKADIKGKTALHVAARIGSVSIMKVLLSTCPDCYEMVDMRGRNALHFVVKSKNKKAIKFILETPSLRNLINEKDEDGNTPFLCAVSMDTRYSMTMKHPNLDIQVFNHQNQNAADINLAYDSITVFSDMMLGPMSVVVEKLKDNLPSSIIPNLRMRVNKNKDGEVEVEGNPMSSGKNNSTDNFFKEAKRNELVAATLIATVTFAAGFTVPGGLVADKGPDQGTAILIRNAAFRIFVLLNTTSMILSSFSVFNHVWIGSASTEWDQRKLARHTAISQTLITYALVAMIGAFISGSFAVLHSSTYLAIFVCVWPVALFAWVCLLSNLAWKIFF